MGFISELKKVGLDILKGVEFGATAFAKAEGYGNIVNAILPASVASKIATVEQKAAPALQAIDDITNGIEAVSAASGSMSGADKLNAASKLAATAYSDFMSIEGKDVQDKDLLAKAQQEFQQGIQLLVQANVDRKNAFKAQS